jgi:hypothetical protein
LSESNSFFPISPNAYARSNDAATSEIDPIEILKNRLLSKPCLIFPFPSARFNTDDAVASIVLNLAEGNARKSEKERRRFFEIARGSVIEVAACIDLALAFGLTGKERGTELKLRLTQISKMIWGLMR